MAENNELLKMFDGCIENHEKLTAKLISQFTCFMIQYRLDHHLTQKEMAQKLHISQAMISKIESEDYNFTLNMMAKICDCLNYDLDLLLKNLDYTGLYALDQKTISPVTICESSTQYGLEEKVEIDLSQVHYELKDHILSIDKNILLDLLDKKI